MNTPITWNAFEAQSHAAGYPEVVAKQWAADLTLDEHSHPFDVQARVVEGELWLGCGEHSQHLSAGDVFNLAAHTPHTERYGAQGALVWIARRPV
jgi:quercetin dioxygenase-like cupin family protein